MDTLGAWRSLYEQAIHFALLAGIQPAAIAILRHAIGSGRGSMAISEGGFAADPTIAAHLDQFLAEQRENLKACASICMQHLEHRIMVGRRPDIDLSRVNGSLDEVVDRIWFSDDAEFEDLLLRLTWAARHDAFEKRAPQA